MEQHAQMLTRGLNECGGTYSRAPALRYFVKLYWSFLEIDSLLKLQRSAASTEVNWELLIQPK